MIFLEFLFRGATASLAIFFAALILRQARTARPSKWVALFLFSAACAAVIHTAQGVQPPQFVRAALLPASASFIVFLWLAARAYFDDAFRFGAPEFGVVASWLVLLAFDYAPLASGLPTGGGAASLLRQALSWGLVGHLLYVAVMGRSADLVEPRRRVRLSFAAAALAIYLLNKAGEAASGYEHLPLAFTTVLYGLFAMLLATALYSAASLDAQMVGFEDPKPPPKPLSRDAARLIERIEQVVDRDAGFLDPDLSIGSLANRVGAPEHAVRVLINQNMGCRNFRSYLNEKRIRHAHAMLRAPACDEMSIAEIALQSGFGSLASFNRVFKTAVGKAPSEIRRQRSIQEISNEAPEISPQFQN